MVRYRVVVRNDSGHTYDKVVAAIGWNFHDGILVFMGLDGLNEAFAPGHWLHVERLTE